VGAAFLAAAPGASDTPNISDETGEETASDQDVFYGLGVVGLGVGIPMTVIAAVDSARAADRTTELPPREELARRHEFSCNEEPVVGQSVVADLDARRVELGYTDLSGRVHASLDQLLERAWVTGSNPYRQMTVPLSPVRRETISLEPYLEVLEAEAYRDAEMRNDLEAWQSYLQDFPNGAGRVAAEARISTLHAERTRQLELADWEAARAQGTVEAVVEYLQLYPASSYTSQARIHTIELLIDDGRLAEAEEALAYWWSVDYAVAQRGPELQAAIEGERSAAASRVERTLSRAVSRASDCSSGGCSGGNVEIAEEIYDAIDSVRGRVSSRRVEEAEMRVIVACGCTRSAVGR